MAGDSAGGNLATVTALMARRRRAGHRFQLLIYPCTDVDPGAYESFQTNANGYFLTRDSMHWFYGHYADVSDHKNSYCAPIEKRPGPLRSPAGVRHHG